MRKSLFILGILILSITITIIFCSNDDEDTTIQIEDSSTTTIDLCPKSAPSNIKASDNLEKKIEISWDSVENASSYNIYRSDKPNGVYKLINSTENTSYEDNITIDDNREYNFNNRFVSYNYKIDANREACDSTIQSDFVKGLSINKKLKCIIDTYIDSGNIYDLAIDASNNLYLVGITNEDVGEQKVSGTYDIIVIKYSFTGEKLWTKVIGGPKSDIASKIAIDSNGDLFITGYTDGSIDDQTNVGNDDCFIIKCSSNGEKLWTKLFGSLKSDTATDIVIDNTGNIFITGYTLGNMDTQINSGSTDVFIAKFTNTGEKLWTRLYASAKYDYAFNMVLSKTGDVFITGNNADEDASGNLKNFDIFLAKYSSAGELLWTKTISTDKNDYVEGIDINNNDEIFITGYTDGYLDKLINYGNGDIFIAKYSSNGDKLWTKLFGNVDTDISRDIKIDNNGNIFIVGSSKSRLDNQENSGDHDMLIIKYNTNGDRLWTKLFGTSNYENANRLYFDSNNNAIFIGFTKLNGYSIVDIVKLNVNNENNIFDINKH